MTPENYLFLALAIAAAGFIGAAARGWLAKQPPSTVTREVHKLEAAAILEQIKLLADNSGDLATKAAADARIAERAADFAMLQQRIAALAPGMPSVPPQS